MHPPIIQCHSSYIDQGRTADVQARTTKDYNIMERIPQAQGIHARVSSSDKNLGHMDRCCSGLRMCMCMCCILHVSRIRTHI